MEDTRQVAIAMAREDIIDICQKGLALSPPFNFKGPIRLRLRPETNNDTSLFRKRRKRDCDDDPKKIMEFKALKIGSPNINHETV
jgi:hypothetical protein